MHVVVYGQSTRFRSVKYAILLPLAFLLYLWKGPRVTGYVIGVLLVISVAIHFFFRYKSKGWSESWWLYKKTEGTF